MPHKTLPQFDASKVDELLAKPEPKWKARLRKWGPLAFFLCSAPLGFFSDAAARSPLGLCTFVFLVVGVCTLAFLAALVTQDQRDREFRDQIESFVQRTNSTPGISIKVNVPTTRDGRKGYSFMLLSVESFNELQARR